MRPIDYNQICQVYDDVRQEDVELINRFLQEISPGEQTRVLDFGCGTGNHTCVFQRLTGAQTWGIDPSDGMLEKARAKKSRVVFARGDGEHIPFEDQFFDFVFMTDVVHHVPDIERMFVEICRVLKPGGKACVVTQSHRQIDLRPTSAFFPGTALADKRRYPDIDRIQQAAVRGGLHPCKVETLGEGAPLELGAEYLELVEKKGYSMFYLIDDAEYCQGRERLRAALSAGPLHMSAAGGSLVWLLRPAD